MRRVPIDDPRDPRLSPFLDLRDTGMRAAREPAEGFFLAEGALTIRRALAGGYEPRAVLATERMLAELEDLDVVAYLVSGHRSIYPSQRITRGKGGGGPERAVRLRELAQGNARPPDEPPRAG